MAHIVRKYIYIHIHICIHECNMNKRICFVYLCGIMYIMFNMRVSLRYYQKAVYIINGFTKCIRAYTFCLISRGFVMARRLCIAHLFIGWCTRVSRRCSVWRGRWYLAVASDAPSIQAVICRERYYRIYITVDVV